MQISEEWETPSSERGHLLIKVLQPSLTHTIRAEIDPLEWAELLGNIGGIWGECELGDRQGQ